MAVLSLDVVEGVEVGVVTVDVAVGSPVGSGKRDCVSAIVVVAVVAVVVVVVVVAEGSVFSDPACTPVTVGVGGEPPSDPVSWSDSSISTLIDPSSSPSASLPRIRKGVPGESMPTGPH